LRRPSSAEPIHAIAWTAQELDRDRIAATEHFRLERLEEPLEEYLDEFDRIQGVFENLLELSVDLGELHDHAIEILTNPELKDGFRYLAGPPLSEDDLKTVVGADSLSQTAIRKNPELVGRIMGTIRDVMDQRRFPWVREEREPTELERHAAVMASAALVASQRVQTKRRNLSKTLQEESVGIALCGADLTRQSPTSSIVRNPDDWPPVGGFFAREITLVSRKADLLVRLWDGRLMPIECKVSNSSLNSVKRLNNDAAAKAGTWINELGTSQIVPVAVLSGVYKLHNLQDAQNAGLMLIWAHRLADLTDWIESTRPG
jgi:hypothetical protein